MAEAPLVSVKAALVGTEWSFSAVSVVAGQACGSGVAVRSRSLLCKVFTATGTDKHLQDNTERGQIKDRFSTILIYLSQYLLAFLPHLLKNFETLRWEISELKLKTFNWYFIDLLLHNTRQILIHGGIPRLCSVQSARDVMRIRNVHQHFDTKKAKTKNDWKLFLWLFVN